jgi:diguanylate cyclase (GGDEF)-like protein
MRVLIADDDPVSRHRLQRRLAEWGYEPVVVTDGDRAWEALEAPDPPELAVLDWMMPGLDGLEICRRLRRDERSSYTYVILLTGKSAKADLLAGLEAGADDYLTKPFDLQELAVRMRIGKRIVSMQHELRLRATRDPLTGALNRGAVCDVLGAALRRAAETREPISTLLIDIDHFKHINDEHGHPAGDEVLREVVRRLGKELRAGDRIGRYGGEEFVVVLPGCDAGAALTVAERLRCAMAGERFAWASGSLAVTASFGVSTWNEGDSLESLLTRADQGLYEAKRSGRNRVALRAADHGPRSAGARRSGSFVVTLSSRPRMAMPAPPSRPPASQAGSTVG